MRAKANAIRLLIHHVPVHVVYAVGSRSGIRVVEEAIHEGIVVGVENAVLVVDNVVRGRSKGICT